MPDDPRLRIKPVRDRRPLSVQVYDRLAEALAKHRRPGDVIPPEIELSAELGVSRTVLREALRLLEEDGFIERGSDPRRRQLAHPSTRRQTVAEPLESVLNATPPLTIKVVRTEVLAPTAWSKALLELDDDETRLLCRETLFQHEGRPAASALEFVPMRAGIPTHLVEGATGEQAKATLLHALGQQFRAKCVPTAFRLAAGPSGSRSREGFPHPHDKRLVTSMLIRLSRRDRPVYLAKHLLHLELVSLVLGEGLPEAEAP